jgi:hypothetical protein
MLHGGGAFSW